jgi:uncharacterized membrane protein
MVLSLGIKLVIALPSFLFLIGFILKGILEKHQIEQIHKLNNYPSLDLVELGFKHYLDFLYMFSIESVFLIVANGLIIIFEIQKIELGILLIIAGLILSIFTSIGSYVRNPFSTALGLVGTMYIVGWELGYFLSQDLEKIWFISASAFPSTIADISMYLSVLILINLTFTKMESLSKLYLYIKKLIHLH